MQQNQDSHIILIVLTTCDSIGIEAPERTATPTKQNKTNNTVRESFTYYISSMTQKNYQTEPISISKEKYV
jgi:hypothetical protein